MELKEIQEKVNNLFIEDFEIEEILIKPEAHLKNDLGIDSLDFVDIVAIIDREFGFKPVLQELKEIATLNDLYLFIDKKIK
ncbi:MAG: acyl carrier protein [Paludibacteraceae bacterium]|nr:acyl carrier protein [Paludibacteraceae bacterium]